MKPEEQRIAIAKACGWAEITFTGYRHQGIRPESSKRYCNWNRPAPAIDVDDAREWHWLPDYLNSLDAMHEAEKVLRNQFNTIEETYWRNLSHVKPHPIYATAAQRAEAFLKTLSLWKDEN
jgi:hypothetical protein